MNKLTLMSIPRLISVLLFLIILSAWACKPRNPYVYTPISGKIVIDTQEQEIIFDKPFKPGRQVVQVCFDYPDDLDVFAVDDPPRFRDGTPLIFRATVVDQNGQKYDLNSIAYSTENRVCIIPELTGEWMDISQKNVAFVKLIISSNRKINVSKIEWMTFNTWDI